MELLCPVLPAELGCWRVWDWGCRPGSGLPVFVTWGWREAAGRLTGGRWPTGSISHPPQANGEQALRWLSELFQFCHWPAVELGQIFSLPTPGFFFSLARPLSLTWSFCRGSLLVGLHLEYLCSCFSESKLLAAGVKCSPVIAFLPFKCQSVTCASLSSWGSFEEAWMPSRSVKKIARANFI